MERGECGDETSPAARSILCAMVDTGGANVHIRLLLLWYYRNILRQARFHVLWFVPRVWYGRGREWQAKDGRQDLHSLLAVSLCLLVRMVFRISWGRVGCRHHDSVVWGSCCVQLLHRAFHCLGDVELHGVVGCS